MDRSRDLPATLNRLADALEGRAQSSDVRYVFDPKPDMRLDEVIALLRTLNIFADADQILSPQFPDILRRHFRPQV